MTEPLVPKLPCACASSRRASRALTQLYEEALRPLGIRATQFTILQALSLTGEVSQGELGRVLALDSTTLTRTLEIMIWKGWIVRRDGKDRRERRLRLGKAGKTQLMRATPHWERVQARLRRQFGTETWDNLLRVTNEVTQVVIDEGGLL
jgi:DNA-binding MarR family transcriptional regulator